jgi:hypothetical protein
MSGTMAHIDLVALIVRDYDAAIRFFVDLLQFELVEDTPSLTNDGRPKRWVVVRPAGAQTASCSRAPTANSRWAPSASSSLAASDCSCASTISRRRISACSPAACISCRRPAMSHTAGLPCSWISKGTAGTLSGETREVKDVLRGPRRAATS